MPKLHKSDLIITKHPINGSIEVTALIGGYFVRRRYFDYTKREAVRLFMDEFSGK